MKKFLLAFYTLSFISFCAFSQQKDIKERYSEIRYFGSKEGSIEKRVTLMVKILNDSSQLTLKQITWMQFYIGKYYEGINKPDSAIFFFEKSLKGEPDYEVAHRALGFIYMDKTKPYVDQINLANKNKDAVANAKAYAEYKKLILKALPHLEKYQACSPDDETLMIISNLYKSLKDTQSMLTIDARLKVLGKRCITLLEDE